MDAYDEDPDAPDRSDGAQAPAALGAAHTPVGPTRGTPVHPETEAAPLGEARPGEVRRSEALPDGASPDGAPSSPGGTRSLGGAPSPGGAASVGGVSSSPDGAPSPGGACCAAEGPGGVPARGVPPAEPSPPPPPRPLPVLPAALPADGSSRRRTGVAALSLPYRIGAAVALAVVAVAACVHLGMVFLSVAPANTVSKRHGTAIEEWVYPEFEQNWKLFAPNPLQQNIDVQVRAQVRMADGRVETTGWNDLSAEDGRAIDGSLLPSHTVQNELRRAWDVFLATHDTGNRPLGTRGNLSEEYLRRITVMRLYRTDPTSRRGTIDSVQVRSRTTGIPAPGWSGEKTSTTPVYRVLPWWATTPEEAAGGVR